MAGFSVEYVWFTKPGEEVCMVFWRCRVRVAATVLLCCVITLAVRGFGRSIHGTQETLPDPESAVLLMMLGNVVARIRYFNAHVRNTRKGVKIFSARVRNFKRQQPAKLI